MQAATIASVAAKSFNQIPRIKPSMPIIGTTWQYFKGFGRYSLNKLHEANEDKYHRYGSIVKEEFVPGLPVIHLYDPNDFQTVFRSQGKFPNRPPSDFIRYYRSSRPDRYSTIGMAHSQGEEWLEERSKLAPLLLKSTFIENNLPVQNDICNHFIDFITKTATKQERDSGAMDSLLITDLKESTDRLALESIVSLSLGIQIGCLNQHSDDSASSGSAEMLISTTKQLFEAYNKLYYGPKIWKFIPTTAYRTFIFAEENIYDLASGIMEERRKRSIDDQASIDHHHASIADYLSSREPTDISSIAVTIADFIAGGTFTVSTSLVYALYHLSHNKHAQDKVYEEISCLSSANERKEDALCGQVTMQDLSRMSYLKACVKESFRLTPTTPAVVRVLQEDAILSGYQVPKGVTVFSHFLVTCRLEKYFDDPLVYKPDRWINKGNKASNNPFALLPFGFGNRMCIGRRFSEIQLYLALAKVISKFKVEPVTKSLDLTHAFIVVPSHEVAIRLIPRH